MRECVDEGMLQGYFDGELSAKTMERVASHLMSCRACTEALSELENQSVLLASAFEPELALSVPTERLRQRLDSAIAGNPAGGRDVAPALPVVRGWLQPVVDLFTLSPQRAFGYVALAAVILFAAVFASMQFRRTPDKNPPVVAKGKQSGVKQVGPPVNTASLYNFAVAVPVRSPEKEKGAGIIAAAYAPKKSKPRPAAVASESDHVKLLPGERSYLKTIAALDTTIKSEDIRPMRPALQSEYERNLAMVDRAIAATRNAAKSNPNDPDAAEFMFAAYQSKVDFLNQVADARLTNKQH